MGDIAEELKRMKAQGMTYASVQYALGEVYWEEIEADAKRLADERAYRGLIDTARGG